MEDSILSKCLAILKKDNIKNEIKEIASPILEGLIEHIFPYIFIIALLILLNFILILGIFYRLFSYTKLKPLED